MYERVPELKAAVWRKSSYSGSGNACVEVARMRHGIAIRDSKDAFGPMLVFGRDEVVRFAEAVRQGRYDL
ncbi:UNVERIFIED_ORG: uncharacterized protein DUF397 [Actinomadura viridilutea]|nr:DUF397 domain-containing protein [Actinomadura rubrobrunea]